MASQSISSTASPYDVFVKVVGDASQQNEKDNPTQAVDRAIQEYNDPSRETQNITILIFIKSLLGFCGNHRSTCAWILTKIQGPNLRDSLANLLFNKTAYSDLQQAQTTAPDAKLEILASMRTKFFRAEPLAAVQVLVETNVFYLNDPKVDQSLALRILNTVLSLEIALDSPKLMERVQEQSQDQEGKLPSTFHSGFAAALKFVKISKLLCQIAEEADDVPRLYRIKKYRAIRSIATERKAELTSKMKDTSTEKNVDAIHNAAQRLDCWNEHFWLAMMEARRKNCVPIDFEMPARLKNSPESHSIETGKSQTSLTPKAQAASNIAEPRLQPMSNSLTDIFQLEDMACETCCSITSLTAYFADLMAQLQNTYNASGDTLLDILTRRRPDLMNLQLSCTNAQTMIPYIALVNEVLESCIQYNHDNPNAGSELSDLGAIIAYNTPEDAQMSDKDFHTDTQLYQPGNTIESVYSTIISEQMYPFTEFPYNKARDEVSQILGHFQIRMPELVEAFKLRQDLLSGIAQDLLKQPELRGKLMRGIEEGFARHAAAEAIHLHQSEFSAITGESFFSSWFTDLVTALSDPSLRPKFQSQYTCTTSTLWGYQDKKDMFDINGQCKLSLIKSELMKRSGLELQDIIDLAKTQCFGQDLIIVNKAGTHEFKNSLSDLLLLMNNLEPPFGQLTEDLCFNLQAFLRLQAKLKWTTKELDAAIICLRTREAETVPTIPKLGESSSFSISPFVVKNISAMEKLSQMTGIDNLTLLSLWGPIDTYGSNSLMYRKFLTPELANVSPIFEIPKNDRFLAQGGTFLLLSQAEREVCIGLGWPTEHFNKLLEATSLQKIAEELNIESFSILYRHVLICQILSIPPKDCDRFFKLFEVSSGTTISGSPLQTPCETLAMIQRWKRFLNSGWTTNSLWEVLMGPESTFDVTLSISKSLQMLSAISQGAMEMRNSLPFLSTTASPNTDNFAECTTSIFDAKTAKVVSAYVDGTQVISSVFGFLNEDALNEMIEESSGWPKKLKFVPDASSKEHEAKIMIVGNLTVQESIAIENLSTKNSSLKQEIGILRKKALAPGNLIQLRFQKVQDENIAKLINSLIDGGINADASMSENEEAHTDSQLPSSQSTSEEEKKRMETERSKRKRREIFMKIAAPTVVQELLETLAINTVQGFVPKLSTDVVSVLLSKVIEIPSPSGKGRGSAMAAIQYLCEARSETSGTTLDAYFRPATTDIYTFSCPEKLANNSDQPQLTVNGITMPFDSSKGTWTPISMSSGQYYHLNSNFSAFRLFWANVKSLPLALTSQNLVSATKTEAAMKILAAVRRVGSICQTFSLNAVELEYFGVPNAQIKRMLAVNFNAPTLGDLTNLEKYTEWRDKLQPSSSSEDLISFFRWLWHSSRSSRNEVASRISACTGWDEGRVLDILNIKYHGLEVDHQNSDWLTYFRNSDEIFALRDMMLIDQRLSIAAGTESRPSISTLFDTVRCRYLSTPDSEVVAANSLRAKLTPSQRTAAGQGMMQNQRKALVAYLLQQNYVKNLKLNDADGLFEHFLIDVQMGPQLRTSRIKQAISVVQLFAQRCLLGLEKQVSKNNLIREQWEWRQQYSLWEAHVKMFLYPENWLDPSLRDDKSQLFEEFEASLMKKNLSLDTYTQAIKTYVFDLNEISSLEVVACVHETLHGGSDLFHLFGRTRSSPYGFYYRTLTLWRIGTTGAFWRPWKKIEIDISSVENDWEGNRLSITGSYLIPILAGGRLYLFIPQLTPKTVNADLAFLEGKKFETLSGTQVNIAKPTHMWDITMAWTELSRGTWTPKRVSTGSVKLEKALTEPNALRFEPRFNVDRSNNQIVLIASAPESKGSLKYEKFGGFSFCEDQMSVLSAVEVTATYTTPQLYRPCFQQEIAEDIKSAASLVPSTALEDAKKAWTKTPFYWLPQALTDVNNNNASRKTLSAAWTLSYKREEGAFSVAMNAKRSDGTSISYFNLPKKKLFPLKSWTTKELNESIDMVVMDHTFSHELMEATAIQVDSLRKVFRVLTVRELDSMPATFGEDASSITTTSRDAKTNNDATTSKGKPTPIYHELAKPSALYNWEIALHSVLLAMDRFFTTQQFEEALKIGRFVFDPTVEIFPEIVTSSPGSGAAKMLESCWKFPPFRQVAEQIKEKNGANFKLSDLASDSNFNLAIMERRSHGALVHATARGRPEAYMKWIVMKYAEILIAAGDVHFRRCTLESLPLAIQRYIEASHILGPQPPKIPQLSKRKPLTFNDLSGEDVQLALSLPFSTQLMKGSKEQLAADPNKEQMTCYLRTTYFCVPLNPKFKQIRNLVNERLYNIRNSLDIHGNPVIYALIEPPIDPSALMALSAQGLSISDALAVVIGDQDTPLPRQRFEHLLQRALELCTELRGLGERVLAAVEKKEGEIFSAARARHTVAIQTKMLEIKKTHVNEAQQTIESLMINRDSQVSQLAFYLALIGEPMSTIPTPKDPWNDIRQDIDTPTIDDMRMSSYERMEMTMSDGAAALNLVAAGIDGLVAPLCAIPDFQANAAPVGVGASISTGGRSIAMAVSAGSTLVKMMAMMAGDEASRASRKAQLTRQLQDRRLQANVRGREIKSIDKQIEIQKIRVQAAQREIDMQQSEIEEAAQVELWYRTKYTSEQLYGWIEKSLRSLYYQAYTLAVSTARKAESALSFEMGRKLTLLRPGGYWDTSRDGLLGADHLYLDLKRLETAYVEAGHHDFEIARTVSLRQIDPLALMSLRIRGTANFSLSENLFDADFPGHYMRRIRSVSLSIPAIVGPNTSINATLRLTAHRYRTSSAASNFANYASQERDDFRTDRIPISAVAISSGMYDSGVFDLSFSGPRYAPFEGAGAISSWQLDLPEFRKFEYESISDILLHVQYTALDGGACLRSVSSETVRTAAIAKKTEGRDEGFWAMWDLKNDFPNEWRTFKSKLIAAKKSDKPIATSSETPQTTVTPSTSNASVSGESIPSQEIVSMPLGNLRGCLSFQSRQQPILSVRNVTWVSKSNNFVTKLKMNGLKEPSEPATNIKIEPLGKCSMKTWSNLEGVNKLEGWELTAPPSVLDNDNDEVTLANMYMLIRYTYG